MSSLFGLSFGALWPGFLAALPLAIGCLVYLFRAKGISEPKVTSSLFILKKLPSFTPSRRRFVPPLQFWLELLVALALVLAASGIYQSSAGKRIAVVIDNSKSMSAVFTPGETRLEAARRIAAVDISGAEASTKFSIFSAAKTLVEVSDKDKATTSSNGVATLDKVKPGFDEDLLPPLVMGLAASSDYDQIWLYTDRTVEGERSGNRLRVTSLPIDQDSLKNLWISGVSLKRSGESDDKVINSQIEVRVGGQPESVTNASVVANCFSPDLRSNFDLGPVAAKISGSDKSSAVTLGPISSDWSYCRVLIDSDAGDSLSIDDKAWIASSDSPTKRVGLFSEFSAASLGIDSLPYAAVSSLSDASQADDSISGVIYHRGASPEVIVRPSLIIYPDAGAKILGGDVGQDLISNASGGIEITRWDETHPILRYARPELLAPKKARVVECPQGSKPFIFTASGPIACAGTDAGRSFVILGFELFPFDGLKNPTLSIITLNALQWILNSTGEVANQSGWTSLGVFNPVGLSDQKSYQAKIVAPNEIELGKAGVDKLEVSEPGVVVVSSDDKALEKIFAFNAISDQESQIDRAASIRIGDDILGGASSERQSLSVVDNKSSAESFYNLLASLALVVLLIDLARRALVGLVSRRGA